MTKLCLVALNSAWYQSNPALYYLRGALRGLPFQPRILDFTVSEPVPDVLAALFRAGADIYCFSAYIWNKSYLQALIPELKKLRPSARIVLGGPEAQFGDFGLALDDFVVVGPGEGVLRSLAESGFSLPGGVYQKFAPPLLDLPFPYRKSDKAALQGKLVYYETSRGCPFRCVYCLSALDPRNEMRFDPSLAQDRSRLYSELDRLLELKPRTLKFVDRSFNTHPLLARLVWDFAIRRGAGCEFHFEIFPDLLTEQDLQLLEKTPPDRIRFEIGIQTVNSAVAKACGRNSDWRRIKPMLSALRERTAIKIHADLLAGLPSEKLPSILRSLDELAAIFPHEIQLGILKILPGTPMLEIARRRGYKWLDTPPSQTLETDALTFGQLAGLQDLARVVNMYWNKGEFASEWKNLLGAGQRASKLFQQLLQIHRRKGIPLHSVSKQDRYTVFTSAFPS